MTSSRHDVLQERGRLRSTDVQMSPEELVHLRLIHMHRVHHVPELRAVVVDHRHHLVMDGLVVQSIGRGVVDAVVVVVRAVVVMMRAVVVVIVVRDGLVRYARCLHRRDVPVPDDRLPIDMPPLNFFRHVGSLLRLVLGPRQVLHSALLLDVHGLPLLPIGLVHLMLVMHHHLGSARVGVQRVRDVAQVGDIPATVSRDLDDLGLSFPDVLDAVFLSVPVLFDSPEPGEVEAVPKRQRLPVRQLDFGVLPNTLIDVGPRQLLAHAGRQRVEVATLHFTLAHF